MKENNGNILTDKSALDHRVQSSKNNRQLRKQLKNLLGFRPGKTAIYQLALRHRSTTDSSEANNERLEYLGDAVLGAIIGDYLYKKYPTQSEGYLTEMRSKIVNRHSLNDIAIKMGLRQITFYDKNSNHLKISGIFGNTLEALIGAVYLDKGYKKTRTFIIQRILHPFVDIAALELEEINHKNKLYSWANKNGHELEFQLEDEHQEGGRRLFTMITVIDGKKMGRGKAFSKKNAGQIAAQATLKKLHLPENH